MNGVTWLRYLGMLLYPLLLTSCGPGVNYDQEMDLGIKKLSGCPLDIYMPGDNFSQDLIHLGSIYVGENMTATSLNCGRKQVLRDLKDRACEEGADVVQIYEIKEPDFWSTCFRMRAHFFTYRNLNYQNQSPEVLSKQKTSTLQQNKAPKVVTVDKIDTAQSSVIETKKFSGKYYALLIANNDYNYTNLPDLKTPADDALALKEVLSSKYNFNVQLLLDAERDQVIEMLYHYRKMIGINDKLLIFYAGHGWMDREADEGYWLPVNASADNPIQWISNSSIIAAIRAMRAKHIIVISDSCFAGKLTRNISNMPADQANIDKITARKARVVITSGGLEPVLDSGGQGGHSVFAAALLESLSENKEIIDTASLFSLIRAKVSWNADQVPEMGIIHKAGHEGGDFFFIPNVY